MQPRTTLLRPALLASLAALLLLATAAAAPAQPPAPAATLAAAQKLSSSGFITAFDVSPADRRAVYLGALAVGQPLELFSVPVAGGMPLRLNAPLAVGTSISTMQVSPTGGQAVYLAQHEADSAPVLYSVPTGGGVAAPLASPQALGNAIEPIFLSFTPDGSQVLFRVETRPFGGKALYRVPAAGGAPVKIADDVLSFQVTPDSARVVYVVDGVPNSLWSAPLDGSAPPVVLSAIFPSSTVVISPDSGRVVYVQAGPFGENLGLASRPVGGGDEAQLWSSAGGNPQPVSAQVAPEGDRVLFTTNALVGMGTSVVLRSVPITGGESVVLGQVLNPGGAVASIAFFPAPGGRVVYQTFTSPSFTPGAGTATLFSAPSSGGDPTLLLNLGSETITPEVVFSADGARMAFGTTGGVYVGSTTTGSPVKVATTAPLGGPALADDGRAIYAAGGQLRAITLDGQSNLPIETLAGETPSIFELNGATVVYLGALGEMRELYASDIPPLAPPDPKPFKVRLPLVRQ